MSQFYYRDDELRKLNKRYAGDKFECIVIYWQEAMLVNSIDQ